jgi:preprotein translocase subunit SecE
VAIFRKRDEEEPEGRGESRRERRERSQDQTPAASSGQGMSREVKRMMAKREGAADRLKRTPAQRRQRTKPLQFLREVRGELARVAWPTRTEVVTYTFVVLISVIFFMVIIAGMDYGFAKGVLWLLRRGEQ